MAFDGIVTRQVIYELNQSIVNGKINKVFQPSKNEILLGIYSNQKNYALYINIEASNCRFHLTTSQKPNPQNALNFCMLLRKHLIGMKITSIKNENLERIAIIELEGFNELNDISHKKLIIELMGKHSNIILLNENDVIIDSLRHVDKLSGSTRDILPAHKYISPQSDKISILNISSFEKFYETINSKLSDMPIDTLLADTFTGISKSYINFLLENLNLKSNITEKEDLKKLYETLSNILHNISLTCKEWKYLNKDDYALVINNNVSPLTVNFFLDDFYLKKESKENFITYRNSVLKLILNELQKYTKRLSNMDKKLEECNKKDSYRIFGELITANLYNIDNSTNIDHIELSNYYNNNEIISIPLDKKLSPSENAKKYFKLYHKLKNACEIVSKQKIETKTEIQYIESIVYELENAESITDIDLIYNEVSENFLKNTLKLTTNNKKAKNTKTNSNKLDISNVLQYDIDGYKVFIRKK